MTTTVLVPLRDHGKTRLSPAIDPEARGVLAAAMLADVIAAVRGAQATRIVVLAGGPDARTAATSLAVDVLDDVTVSAGASTAVGDGGGIDRAVAGAVERIGGDVLVVAADLPTLRAAEVAAMLEAPAAVAVAPTRRGGTGGLLRRPASAMPTAYGPDSAARHLATAAAAGLTAVRLELPGFATDLDTPGDVAAIDRDAVGPATRAALDALGLSGRASVDDATG
jgi:2-phospho-L-lactate/phosphoenolpyruvate guanylyltransferase